MKLIIPISMALILAAATVSSAADETAASASKSRTRSSEGPGTKGPPGKLFVYKHTAGEPQQMEIFFPPNHDPSKAKVPGMILFHGGGWSGGNLQQFRVACAYFASRGLVCATADYRMLSANEARQLPAGETKKRICVVDAKSAIRWFRRKAPELGIDPHRIITGGGSAGGHISVLATTNPGLNDPGDPNEIETSVVAYVLFNPAFALDDDQDLEIDVLRHLQPKFAPAIVFFGDQDPWKKGWDKAHAKLMSLGSRSVELQIAPGQAHGFFNREPWQTATLIAADRFLVKQGLLSGEPTRPAPATGEKLVLANP
ncbi:MAG: alpha/beta hydrolase [Planctomycetaceae bacterium]|nr:alpha/beta hydrolase [Planctomycetaceae bacterium]